MPTGSPIDPRWLERVLAPLSGDAAAPAVAVIDPDGTVLGGRLEGKGGASDQRITAEVVVDGEVVARVVASGRAATIPGLAPAIASLAAAIEALVDADRRRGAAEDALHHERAAAAAAALGSDAGELEKGRRQQRRILSLVPPDVQGYDLASHYAAAREIGGDFFELFRLRRRGRPLAITVADVTGKGLDAALLMAFARPVLHSALEAAAGPADALDRTNRVLVGERRGTLFITAIAAVLEPRSGRVRLANAGHEPPLLVPGDGRAIEPVGEPGVLLGAFDALGATTTEIELEPGDRLFCYTDGVTDAVGPSGERFGDDRLLATLESAREGGAHELVRAVVEAVGEFAGHVEAADDLTIVAVGRAPRQGRRRAGRADGV